MIEQFIAKETLTTISTDYEWTVNTGDLITLIEEVDNSAVYEKWYVVGYKAKNETTGGIMELDFMNIEMLKGNL